VEAGKAKFEFVELELDSLLKQAAGMFRTQSERKGVRLKVEAQAGLPLMKSDPSRLKQVLFNYISNAIKFSEAGKEIWVRAKKEGDSSIRLEVQDQGIGIAKENQARLFSEFEQLDAGMDKKYQGTGLGLALSAKLVEHLGGRVGVESELGKGSLFYAVLPLHPETA
jgi:signal transduction histidine kinase